MNTDAPKFDSAKWSATISALLANAEDPCLSESARQTYAAKAADLMTRHRISDEQLHAAQTNRADPEAAADLWPYAVPGTHHLGPARARAASAIAEAMGCKAAAQENPAPAACIVAIIGAPADLDTLRTLLPLVMRQAELAAASAAANGNRAPSYLTGFLTGYGNAVAEHITTRRRDMINETPGAEIILASRANAVEKLYDERLGSHLTRQRHADPHNTAGRAAGHAAGRRADLGDTRLGHTGPAAISS